MSVNSVEEASDLVQMAVDHLKDNLGYECGVTLGKGTYGSVVKVTNRESNNMAAKIVERRLLNDLEILIWPKLDHSNILKLITIICDLDDVVIFLTDLMATNLFLRLQDRSFKEDPKALERCQTYAKQILSGISYLHRHELCHLDIRAENIFLSADDDRAVVADFSGLSWAQHERRYCPLPHALRPPEMLSRSKRVHPLPVDLWACGLIIANLFLNKGFYVCTIKHEKAGHMEAVQQYTALFQSEVYVTKFISETYTSCYLPIGSVKQFISLVRSFLRMHPKNRASVDEGLNHPFLQKNLDGVVKRKITLPKTNSISEREEHTEEDILGTAGDSAVFQVALSDEKIESALLKQSLGDKIPKANMWTKYKRRFKKLGLLQIRSVPFFKSVKLKYDDRKKTKQFPKVSKN